MSQEIERTPGQEQSAEELRELLQIRRDKLTRLQAEGCDPFREVRYDRTHHTDDIIGHFDEMENQTVSLAGRIMSKRDMGKASFCDLQDQNGRVQLYVKVD